MQSRLLLHYEQGCSSTFSKNFCTAAELAAFDNDRPESSYSKPAAFSKPTASAAAFSKPAAFLYHRHRRRRRRRRLTLRPRRLPPPSLCPLEYMRSTSTVCQDTLTNWTACEELAIIGAVSAKWGQASLPPQADLGEAYMYKLVFELVDTNNFLFGLSMADMILQFLFLPLILVYVCALSNNSEALEACHGITNLIFLIIDLTLTIMSVLQAQQSLSQVQSLIAPNCLDLTTRSGNIAENALIKAEDALNKVALLGWMEAAIALFSVFGQAGQPFVNVGQDDPINKEGRGKARRRALGLILIITVMLDCVLSVINFFAFTTDSKRLMTSLASLISGSDAWCVTGQCVGYEVSGECVTLIPLHAETRAEIRIPQTSAWTGPPAASSAQPAHRRSTAGLAGKLPDCTHYSMQRVHDASQPIACRCRRRAQGEARCEAPWRCVVHFTRHQRIHGASARGLGRRGKVGVWMVKSH